MITLSYSTIADIYACSQRWVNKQIGLEREDFPFFKNGREAHEVIQRHITGQAVDTRLDMLSYPLHGIVEAERRYVVNAKYSLYGKIDVLFPDELVEIKTRKTLWSVGEFSKLMQWKVYALMTGVKKVSFITTTSDLSKVKVFRQEVREKDIEDAKDWINGGIKILEDGKFGKPEKPPCYWCVYRKNCIYSNLEA